MRSMLLFKLDHTEEGGPSLDATTPGRSQAYADATEQEPRES